MDRARDTSLCPKNSLSYMQDVNEVEFYVCPEPEADVERVQQLIFEEIPQMVAAGRMLQLPQRLRLDLSDALT